MTDTTFLSSVAVRLLAPGETSGEGWARRDELAATVEARLRDDPAGRRALAAVLAQRASAAQVLDLLAAVRRHADRDGPFLARLRVLVVAAYADPTVLPSLPDPAPES
ncbi:hypothetical protein AB0F81_40355 [Actinoplanes sp. NPDC024001]|uniref:hypothetical protein n=1 Tax=Actinoplanes sp. NPDC024001 TaxID=3154598 RepID=UPI003409002D